MVRRMTTSNRNLQTEDKSLAGTVESKDNPASLTQPQPRPAESVPSEGAPAVAAEDAEETTEVEFIHHYNDDVDGETKSYVPGDKEPIRSHLAHQLVTTKRAKYVAGE